MLFSVCALLTSPKAKGLFTRAIIESGGCPERGPHARPLSGGQDSAHAQGERLAAALGCSGANALACLRSKRPEEVLNAMPGAAGFLDEHEHFGLAIDADVVPDAPMAMVASGKQSRVPVMIGVNADEGTLFTHSVKVRSEADLKAFIEQRAPGASERVLKAYADPALGGAKARLDAIVGDFAFVCPAEQIARALRKTQPVFFYELTQVSRGAQWFHLGAHHGAEIAYVFGTLDSRRVPTSREESALSESMMKLWAQFARTGQPGNLGALEWKPFGDAESYLELSSTPALKQRLRAARCAALMRDAPAR